VPAIARLAPLFLAAVAACQAPPPDPWPAAGPDVERAIGWIDGEPVTYGDLARFLRTRDALTFSRILDALLVDRITRHEADALGVDVPVAAVERRTRARYVAFEQRLAAGTEERGGAPIEPELWLRRTLGLTPDEFRAFLRAQIEVELLQDRLIRFAQLRAPTVEVSILVVDDAASADAARARIEGGESFEVVARAVSRHATAKQGGRIDHRMRAEDFDDEALARRLLAAEPGALLGPLPREADGKTYFRLYRLEAKHAGRDVRYDELRDAVEADLEKRPVSMGEYVDWRRRMQDRHAFLPATAEPARATER